jgi:CAAX protease family protein
MSNELSPSASAPERHGFWSTLCSFAIIRILLGLLIVVGVLAAFQFGFLLAARNSSAKHLFEVTFLPAWVGIAAAVFAYWFFVRWIEKRPVLELQGQGALSETALGVALGAIMFAATIATLALLGYFRINSFNPWTVLVQATAGAAVSAVVEEIIFRGIIFRISEESLGTWLAIVISALLFGAVHMLNPNASLQGGIAIVLEAGIFLAAAFLLTRRLWFVIGAHFGWNFIEGGIFGTAVSGNASAGLINGTVSGPTYLSGGIFGVEASVVAIAICLFVAILLLGYAKTQGRFIAPFWRRI